LARLRNYFVIIASVWFVASGLLFATAFTYPIILLSSSSTTAVGTLGECINGVCTTITNAPMTEGRESYIYASALEIWASLFGLIGVVILAVGMGRSARHRETTNWTGTEGATK
jgi:hypothetical protein